MRIRYRSLIVGITLICIGFSINEAYGAGFIKFDGIDGESTHKGHIGWSNLLSVHENFETNPSSTSQRSEYKPIDEILVVKELDRTGPHIAESIATGKVFPRVSINLCSGGGNNCYLSYELSNVMVTSYSIGGSANEVPTEQISLNFEKIIRNPESEPQRMEKPEMSQEKTPKTTEPAQDLAGEKLRKPRVPDWVQTTAKFWVDKDVSDREFTDALGFLVKEKIIEVEVESELTEQEQKGDEKPQVPAWISQTTDWWINGEVPEDQFLEGIKWMIKNKIIRGIN